ncbi:hypothetical protein DRW41_08865 [Neobacillus piezotolerans]|uniref:Uncharacterized protein n=1 Tax=Neobacillus piezotolerans TaxID=2259171 RepID=A0A3D8GUS7_9BACI|nr:hypothetical protein [Neobacillus piezotolerans]RDU37911.1 hypothetical protein DRW41_08865 [Neobacillus piezotolerans]
MKKIWVYSTLIAYCFPFGYFAIYQDYKDGSMLGYLLLILGPAILAFINKLKGYTFLIVIGNLFSAGVSFYFSNQMAGVDRWGYYFKPLTATSLLFTISILNLIPQFMAFKLAKQKKKN